MQSPCCVTGLHVPRLGKAKDHPLAFGVGYHSLENAVEEKVLFHLLHALMKKELAFLAVHNGELGLERSEVRFAKALEHHVLSKLNPNNVSFRVVRDGRHISVNPI